MAVFFEMTTMNSCSTKPDTADTISARHAHLRNRAKQARQQDRFEESAALYSQAIDLDGRDARVHLEYGEVLMRLAERIKALPYLQRAAHEIDHSGVRSMYAEALSKVRFGRTDPALKKDVACALDGAWCRPADLAGVAMSLLKAEYDFSSETAVAMVSACSGLAAEPLLNALLRNTPNTDEALEEWLVRARATLLKQVLEGAVTEPSRVLPFAIALAMQAWIGEFVLHATQDEFAVLRRLRDTLGVRIAAGERPDELALAMLATYQSLGDWSVAPQLLWLELSPALNRLLTWHIRNPLRERLIAEQILCLTPIEDAVSKKVRAQYEANPYPRWVNAPSNSGRVTLLQYINERFPKLKPEHRMAASGAKDVLIAGCGTGQQPIGTVATLSDVNVLAVDISLDSLAYAKRMVLDMEIREIEFMQADILELGNLEKRFDLIECGGVLHHLGDPEKGWRILTGLLKPGGVMVISLYSRAARRDLEPARALIREKGFASDEAGIKQFRSHVKALPADNPCRKVVRRRDFYTTSMLRDLVFHVNEHEFDLIEIGAMVGRLGLSFLGFDLQAEIITKFKARYGDNAPMADMMAWTKFENDNPDTFRGMYHMWFRARRGSKQNKLSV